MMPASDLLSVIESKKLSPAEEKRLQRMVRSRQNRRGRKQPVVIPAELTRTSAFAPKRQGLIQDQTFKRVYYVQDRSVIEVSGRELGSQHRDALYAIFGLPSRRLRLERPNPAPSLPGLGPGSAETIVEAYGTWRDILRLMKLTEHVNNLLTVLKNFEELRAVNIRVFQASPDQYAREQSSGRITSAGFSDNLLGRIDWDSPSLDGHVTIRYGEYLRQVFEKKRLVSMNRAVYFELKSDHAKSFWPYIESMNGHTWIDERTLADVTDRDLDNMSVADRRNFREACRRAFGDMVAAGGLESFTIETIQTGRQRHYRYHYVHALPRQIELELAAAAGKEGVAALPR